VDEYLKQSLVFIAKRNNRKSGVIVLLPLSDALVEIKNLAVKPGLQGQGIGSFLITEAMSIAQKRKFQSVCIGTANSSTRQLALYKKLGFVITGTKKNFFSNNYPEPIFENGMLATDMIMLTKQL
jgi:aminoglycoside 6'-N-acetyltransferase I